MIVFDQLRKNDAQLQLLAAALCLGLGVLVVGLWWVQIVSARRFQESLETQSFRTVRVPATRGKIFDRNGVVLAENRPSYNVNLYLEELSQPFRDEWKRTRPRQVVTNHLPFWKDWLGFTAVKTQFVRLTEEQTRALQRNARYRVANGVATKIGGILNSPLALDYTNFYKHFDTSRAMPYTVASNLPPAKLACFAEQGVNLPAVEMDVQSLRYYPYSNLTAHVLGYVIRSKDSVVNEQAYYDYRLQDVSGVVGIEGNQDLELRGSAGEKTVVVNNLGFRQTENIGKPVEPGKNVFLTLDLKIQAAATTALRSQAGPGGRGSVVVMDVQTGDVLALVSQPAMDPNYFIRGWPAGELDRWDDAALGFQKNRATKELYQAGSIFKTIVALAALENGLNPREIFRVDADPQNGAKGAYFVGRQRQKFHDTAPPGDYDLERALMHSSNSYFIEMGLRPGVFGRVVDLGQRLHLSEKVGLPLRQESAGIFPDAQRVKRKDWYDGHSANICIGQGGMAVTPMQMAVMTCALANGGKVLKPRLISRIESQDPSISEAPETTPSGQVRDQLGVSQRSIKILHDAMRAETENQGGTGFKAFDQYYRAGGKLRVCGKTGTAEDKLKKMNTTWFISFAPFDHPQFAVVVMVENGVSGGATCAPVARDVYVALEKFNQRAELAATTR